MKACILYNKHASYLYFKEKGSKRVTCYFYRQRFHSIKWATRVNKTSNWIDVDYETYVLAMSNSKLDREEALERFKKLLGYRLPKKFRNEIF